eukprot:1281360-Pyramimonas_sp.AAC.1
MRDAWLIDERSTQPLAKGECSSTYQSALFMSSCLTEEVTEELQHERGRCGGLCSDACERVNYDAGKRGINMDPQS